MAHFSSWGGDASSMYRFTDQDLEQMHQVLLNMYKDINSVCLRHNIKLFAAGGTALGAIRHHGFIPWDDDMDLCMYREDYKKFEEVFSEELGNEYYLLAPGRKQGANCFLPRVMKKNTTLLGMIDEASPYPHGIYIDINPIEYAPEGKIRFGIKRFGADFRRFVSYSVYWNQYPSKSLREYMLKSKGKKYYQLRMLIGKLFSFRSAESWFSSFDRYVQGKRTGTLVIPSGTKQYAGERLTTDIVEPAQEVRFEDTTIKVFNNVDWYLRNLYGDYMKIPDVQHREHHMCLKLDFNQEK